tara:strand:+ start:4614 stop:5231 length:618 start_codon:yes stop_codon:yes gene_type:complete
MIEYNNLLSFGDVLTLNYSGNCSKILKDIKEFEWKQYNPRRAINRYGLSVTSLDGKLNGIDLDSMYQYNKIHNTTYNELSFKTPTEVYYKSEETQKLIEPFKPWLCRTHFLNIKKGGYFPPHRDWRSIEKQPSFRILVPIKDCNPNKLYFIYDGKILNFNYGVPYFVNTNKEHCIFSFSDTSVMLVMNIQCTKESLIKVSELMIG